MNEDPTAISGVMGLLIEGGPYWAEPAIKVGPDPKRIGAFYLASRGRYNPCEMTKGKLTLAVGRRPGGKAILRVEGSVDPTTFKQFQATFRWLNKEGILYVVVDIARMTYISSSGLSLLVKAKTEREKKKGDLVLVRPQTPIVNIMKILGLFDVFRVASSVEEALHPPPKRDQD